MSRPTRLPAQGRGASKNSPWSTDATLREGERRPEIPETISPQYIGVAGAAYAAWQLHATEALSAEVARRFRPFVSPADVCVDFGCGGGGALAGLDVGRRIGVEPNEMPRRVAASRGIEVVSSLGEIGAASVDVVISNHALEHCREPFRELVDMKRVLRPRGRVVLILPLEDWRRSRRFHPNDINHHLFGWTPLLIGNLVTEAGFHVQEISILRHAYPPGAGVLWRFLPECGFDVICVGWSMATLMRQIRVVLQRP